MWELNTETNMDDDKGHCPYSKDTKKSRDQVIFLFYFWKIFFKFKKLQKSKNSKKLRK